ncbi:MAG: VCBS repeat-containing protein, partial [Phycisphaerales bacterium]|nr:VCBS repeat-containing protein [Phycisphaerales bacterium]
MAKAHSLMPLLCAAPLVIALSAGLTGRALAQCPPTFAPATYWSVGSPYSVGVGDFNNDGRPDIVGANFSGSNATVRLASAITPGSYDGPINIALGLNPRGCAVADFNHDGIADIAVVYNGGGPANTKLAIIISNGNGSFQAPVLYATASQPFDVKIADFNHDNNPDIAVVCGCGSISVHLGNANGTFQPYTSHAAGSNASGLAIADFNGDGVLDMFIPSYGSLNIRGAVGLTDAPTFGPLLTHGNAGLFGPWQAAAGDFNEDGRADAVVSFRVTSRLAVQLGNADGTMTAIAGPYAGNQPQDVVAADFNGDGHLDVAVGNWTQSNVTVHLGDGTGALGNTANYYAV